MWLLFFAIFLSTGLAFETVCSFTLHVTDKDTKEVLTRKKRELDEEDVINRFEMERVSPLYDIIYDHLPPFDREWTLPGPPAYKPPQGEFQWELRDEEHVVSHSGKRFRENSAAVKWWYSVESFTNHTRLNYTESSRDIDVSNSLQGPSPVPTMTTSIARTQDQDKVDRKLSNLRSGQGLESESNFTQFGVVKDRNVVGDGNSSQDSPEPRTYIFRTQNVEKGVGQSSNVGTGQGFELAMSQNYTQFGVAKDRNMFRGNQIQNIPGSRTLTTRTQNHEKVINRSSNPRTGFEPSNQQNFTQFGVAKDRKIFLRKQDEDHVVSRVPGLRTGRGSPLDAAVIESPTTPRVAVTLAPKMEESESKPNITTRYILLQSGRIVAINVTSVSSVFKPSSGSGGSNKPAAPMVYFGSRLKKNSSRIDKSKNVTVSSEKMDRKVPSKPPIPLKPTISPILHRVNLITKPTASPVSYLRSTPPVSNLAHLVRDMKSLSTTKPIQKQTPMKSAALLSVPKASMSPFALPPTPTKSVIVLTSTRPPITTRKPSTERTTVTSKPEKLPTRKTTLTYATESTRNMLGTFPTIRTIPTTQYHTLSPRNIVETIFNVLQPGTSDMPFLIVTFDSLKRQFPTANALVEKQSDAKNREYKFATSRVEYEDRDHKPKLIHYNMNPYPPRTSLDLSIGVAAKPTFPTVTSTNRRAYVSSPLSVTPTLAEVPIRAPESHPRMKHEFVRIVTLPTRASLTHPQDEIPTRRPKEHRGVPYITHITNKTPTPPTNQSPPQGHFPTPSRIPRQQQGFHLRNTVGFQTGPPGAFADRRSFADTATTAGSVSEGPSMEKMVEALVFRFEPTRRNTKLEAMQGPTISATATTESLTTLRSRIPTKRPARPSISNAVAPINKPWIIQGTKPRTHSTTTLKPATIATRTGRNSRTRSNPQDTLEKEDGVVSSTTAKPFRVYYFEPKRKRTKKLEETTTPTQEKRTSQSPLSTPRRIQTTNSRSNPRSHLQRQDPPTVTTPHLAPLQTIPTPTQPVDRGRRGRARFNPTTSPTIPLTNTPQSSSTVKPTRKHRHSLFIWHRPNVGTTKAPTLATDTVPAVSSSVVFPRRRSLVEIPPRDSFQDVLFQPVEIERLVTTPAS